MTNDSSRQTESGTILVTGAHGFLGRHAARLLAQQGHRIIGIGHGSWTSKEWAAWGISEWHSTDIAIDALQLYAGRPDAIVHCAGSGSVGFSLEHPLADFERTVVTTAHILEYVRLFSPATRVIYPSSASIYGAVESTPILEEIPAKPVSQYGVHKWMAEQMLLSYATQYQISNAIVRFFSIYGPGLHKQLLWDACYKLSSGDNTFAGTGEEVRDWLHVEDAAGILLHAVRHASPTCPIVNGGSGEGTTVRNILTRVADFISSNPPTLEFSGAARPGDPSRYIADISRASSWGWQPKRAWQEGVEEYVAWWRQSNSADAGPR